VTPDIVVDIGNSRMKWGRCDGGRVVEMVRLPHDAPVDWKRQAQLWEVTGQTGWAVAGVVPHEMSRFVMWLHNYGIRAALVDSKVFAPSEIPWFRTRVDQPHLTGIDRLLTAFAAYSRARSPLAVIGVGTAMTIDFVQGDGTHVGGVILPGPWMMAKALHAQTAKLPEVVIRPQLPTDIWGPNTESAITLGIANAILGVADQLIWDWAVHVGQPPWVYATGGGAGYFRGYVFTADVAGYEIDPLLTLDGIRIAAEALP
jgi:type III pantothenate kinase